MALCHFHVGHIGRAGGQSAIASAAYRAGEELYSEYYGETNDFTRKGGVTYTEIMLPPNAPPEYKDRQTLWNAVEEVEKHKKAQLAYSFDIALQNEFTPEENLELARAFVQECLVDKGMIADLAVHEKTLPTLIQTNETKKSTQIDAFFESKPKIDAFLKIDANAQRQEYKMAS